MTLFCRALLVLRAPILGSYVLQEHGRAARERLGEVWETGFWDNAGVEPWEYVSGERQSYGHNSRADQ